LTIFVNAIAQMLNQKQFDVLKAAEKVFLLHGYARTTMGDIAKGARISRPALYLIFPSKEDVFRAAVENLFAGKLSRLKGALLERKDVNDQLIYAFDVWAIETYELVCSYPEATDLFENSLLHASEITERANGEFREILVEIMQSASKKKKVNESNNDLELVDIAALMIGASIGFKSIAKDTNELRALLRNQISLVLAALGA
jgi:AcrR family transcriptional regulator